MSFNSASTDIADRCFKALGCDVVLIRKNGERIECRGMIDRSYQKSEHLAQRLIAATLPLCNVSSVDRDERLRAEGEEFLVVTEIDRDQDTIVVQLRVRA